MTAGAYGFIRLLEAQALVHIVMTCHVISVLNYSRIKVSEEDLARCMHIPACTDSSQTGDEAPDIPVHSNCHGL